VLCGSRFTREAKSDAIRSAYAHDGVIATRLAQSLDGVVNVCELELQNEVVFHRSFLVATAGGPPIDRAVVDNPLEAKRVIPGVLRGAPDARDAKLSAAAFRCVKRTVHATPGVAASYLYSPAALFGMPNRLFDVFVGMPCSIHLSMTRD
jgi:hypothetical protein